MPEPQSAPRPEPDRVPALADVAQESPAESVRHEHEAVGHDPDAGGAVPPDDAQ